MAKTPICYGVFRSPQHDAEACCHECRFDIPCREHMLAQATAKGAESPPRNESDQDT